MPRSRSASPVRFTYKLTARTADGHDIKTDLSDCVDLAKLGEIVNEENRIAKDKRRAKEQKASDGALAFARTVCPSVIAVKIKSDGGLMDMTRAHGFHGSRHDIGLEFQTACTLEIAVSFPFAYGISNESNFDNQLKLYYVGEQAYDAGKTKVSFELCCSDMDLSFGDLESVPMSKEAYKKMFLGLIKLQCDGSTASIVQLEFLNELDEVKIKFEK